ncbi:MAG: TonB-dependent receptor plug domain-containing protein [Bacteroidales bacterium]|nr:TonB-dependent receptor plug domain-containing protein [Bacteroidales bacterium]
MKTHTITAAQLAARICGVAAAILFTNGLTFEAQAQQQKQDSVRTLDELIISTTRVDNKAPLTTSTLNRQQLEEQKIAVSLPYMLELEPSVVVSGENGPLGEHNMRIRGVDASRINVNINGITLNDAESQEVFWYNIPNLGGMAQSLQLQRGVGASVGGSASLGGAMNLQTLNASAAPYGNIHFGYGSWNTMTYGLSAGTGILKNGLSFDMAYSGQNTDGFVRNAKANQHSLFLGAGHYGERSVLKAIFIMGYQKTGITWNGALADSLDKDPRYSAEGLYYDKDGNMHYYDNQTDNYNQRHYQLYYSLMATDNLTLNAAFDFTHGDGYYEEYGDDEKPYKKYHLYALNGASTSDFIRRREMFNSAYTGTLSLHYTEQFINLDFGANFLYYDGNHFGNVIWAQDSMSLEGTTFLPIAENNPYEWYRNKGSKGDNTVYVKTNVELSDRTNIYADLQMRAVDYTISGIESKFQQMDYNEDYLFFNPKLGLNYLADGNRRFYAVAGLTSREPRRADIKDALAREDTIKAETMLDIELGFQLPGQRFTFNANAYAMLYRDQMTPSGGLSESGYALMENVANSYRIGLELEGGYRFNSMLSFDANLTLSRNRILNYTFTDFTDGDNTLQTFTQNTDLALSPSIIGAAMATFTPVKNLKLQLVGKYVGKQYGDNTSREVYAIDPYFLLNLRASYTFSFAGKSELELQGSVNNLLNRKYRLYAWSEDWEEGWDDVNNVPLDYQHHIYYFQQPGINFMLRAIYRF